MGTEKKQSDLRSLKKWHTPILQVLDLHKTSGGGAPKKSEGHKKYDAGIGS